MMMRFCRTGFRFFCVLSWMVGAALAPAFAGQGKAELTAAPSGDSAWTVRCNDPEKKHCEIYQRLAVKDTGQRVAEFAIGFPENKTSARGVLVLPLGVLLTEGVRLRIDDQTPFRFQVRYCAQDGCYAYVNLNDTVLDMMRKGGKAVLTFKTVQGQDMDVVLSLKGFTKALKAVL